MLPPAMTETVESSAPVSEDPIARFLRWQWRAREGEPLDATVCYLATAGADGRPHVRAVLLKEADERGFVFYTNLRSPKVRQIEENPLASLCFYWASTREQVRVEGRVERVPDREADAYFATRPRMSQIGAWASRQSEPFDSREQLEAAVREVEARYPEGADVPRPPFWGGLRIVPDVVEFWRERPHRLHDRWRYERAEDGATWRCTRLQP